jgi:hypothetical protein
MLVLLVTAVLGGCLFALLVSVAMNVASDHSALWSMGFAIGLVVVAAAVLAIAAIIVTRLLVV